MGSTDNRIDDEARVGDGAVGENAGQLTEGGGVGGGNSGASQGTDGGEKAKDATGRGAGATKVRARGWPKGKKRGPRTEGGSSADGGPAPGPDAPAPAKPIPLSDPETQSLANNIFSAHMLIGMKYPAMTMTQEEAIRLACATRDLSQYYDLRWLMSAGGKWASLLGFAGTVGMIYYPKLKALGAEMSASRVKRPAVPSSPFEAAMNPGAPLDLTGMTQNQG
jgi:hypothetical protein